VLLSSSQRLAVRSRDESGFTLIELLMVIIIVGVLAGIAIPAFASQKNKASDAQAKELARTAETTAETIATDHNGEYATVSKTELHSYETAIPIVASTGGAYLSGVSSTKSEYSVTTKAVDGDEFTITKTPTGEVIRKCVSPVTKTGCSGVEQSSW